MAIGLESVVFTTELKNDNLVITQNMGVQQISIFNTTATTGSVLGTRSLGGVASSAIAIAESQTVTIKAIDASVIEALTIDAPAGCTLQIIAQ
tara:strand:- start:2918 stop:3196 length:279 start_codon:yes stop_codon:yes gene_type:complete